MYLMISETKSKNGVLHILFFFGMALLLISFLNGCAPNKIEVQTKPITHETLASFRVGSPDPMLSTAYSGERLFIQWSLSKAEWKMAPISLYLHLHFRNHTEELIIEPICTRKGYTLYTLLNESFIEKKGILTYKVELKSTSSLIAEWKHPFWTEWITLNPL